jgi:hypothetical protein
MYGMVYFYVSQAHSECKGVRDACGNHVFRYGSHLFAVISVLVYEQLIPLFFYARVSNIHLIKSKRDFLQVMYDMSYESFHIQSLKFSAIGNEVT